MKIAFTSDLHVDYSPENRGLIKNLREQLESSNFDVLIVAGDLASNIKDFGWALEQLSDLRCRKLVVAGNHDIWIESKHDIISGKDSGARYLKLLPEIAAQNGFTFMHETALVIDGIGFAGNMGWFDYSFRNTDFDSTTPFERYAIGRWQHPTKDTEFIWNDMQYVWWLKDLSARISGFDRRNLCLSDADIVDLMAVALQRQLDQLRAEGVKRIVAVTHVVPTRGLLEYRGTTPHDYFNAYHGAAKIESVIRGDNRITHVIYGHSHVRKDVVIDGVRYLSEPIGYHGEGRLMRPLRIGFLEIPD
jgi:predicted phosphodiesterase